MDAKLLASHVQASADAAAQRAFDADGAPRASSRCPDFSLTVGTGAVIRLQARRGELGTEEEQLRARIAVEAVRYFLILVALSPPSPLTGQLQERLGLAESQAASDTVRLRRELELARSTGDTAGAEDAQRRLGEVCRPACLHVLCIARG
jgi:hypothetical protein